MSIFLFFLSLFLVALGRPVMFPWLGVISFVCGFAIFFKAVEGVGDRKRIGLGFLWYSGVQMIQLEWWLSHPYYYIYAVWLFFSMLWAVQFAFFAYFVPKEGEIRVRRRFALAGLWVLIEWSRLYVLSGFSWNPIGLSSTGFLPFLHVTAFVGVYGLSYVSMFLNLTVLEGMRRRQFFPAALVLLIIFLIGFVHLEFRRMEMGKEGRSMSVALVQTAFPVEEALRFSTVEEMFAYVQGEWAEMYRVMGGIRDEKVDLILLPELVVPYGTYMPIYGLKEVEEEVIAKLGQGWKKAMPELQWPYAFQEKGQWKVTNGFLAQTLANFFGADLLIGFEDAERVSDEETEHYNAALLFRAAGKDAAGRYEKRVLVPMGEYIPFGFLRELCKSYGVYGSFTAGKGAKGLVGEKGVYGPSICYEETYGHMMRENKGEGVDLFCNLTSDVWYPNSWLPEEHLAHASPRTVEMGLPLVRACNTGVTVAMNSLGEKLEGIEGEWTRGAVVVEVPLYSFKTVYSYTGDYPVLMLSFLSLIGFYGYRKE
jgi:apolipoprotein N-acyltransferase